MKICASFILVLLLSCVTLRAQNAPEPLIKRVLIVSIDGLRPDVLLRADMPNVRALYENGSFTFWARTTPISLTLPSHVSMMTGVPPEMHRIDWNGDPPDGKVVYPAVPTLFQLAKKAGYTTGLCTGKRKFIVLDAPGSLDFKFIPDDPKIEDPVVTEKAIEMIRKHHPDVMLFHLPTNDNVGHAVGWGTPEQLKAAAGADQCLGQVLALLREMKLIESTLIIVTADHGGAGGTHGEGDPRSRTIPWIASGPGIRKGFDLARLGKSNNVETYDTFATACTVLGIAIPEGVKGRCVSEIMADQELLRSIPTRAGK